MMKVHIVTPEELANMQNEPGVQTVATLPVVQAAIQSVVGATDETDPNEEIKKTEDD